MIYRSLLFMIFFSINGPVLHSEGLGFFSQPSFLEHALGEGPAALAIQKARTVLSSLLGYLYLYVVEKNNTDAQVAKQEASSGVLFGKIPEESNYYRIIERQPKEPAEPSREPQREQHPIDSRADWSTGKKVVNWFTKAPAWWGKKIFGDNNSEQEKKNVKKEVPCPPPAPTKPSETLLPPSTMTSSANRNFQRNFEKKYQDQLFQPNIVHEEQNEEPIDQAKSQDLDDLEMDPEEAFAHFILNSVTNDPVFLMEITPELQKLLEENSPESIARIAALYIEIMVKSIELSRSDSAKQKILINRYCNAAENFITLAAEEQAAATAAKASGETIETPTTAIVKSIAISIINAQKKLSASA